MGASAAAAVALVAGAGTSPAEDAPSIPPGNATPRQSWTCPLLTDADSFYDVSRGKPKPFTLTGDALTQARLTPETWRLEITADPYTDSHVKLPAQIEKPRKISDGTALDLPALMELGRTHSVRYLKAMQCLNISEPLGQGLWEGVPLREVLRLGGRMNNVRRIYYWGFHNNDPAQLFQSSLSHAQVMETPPGELPAFVAYRLNGEPIPLKRGGPVRMVVPWAHGFKSIKWLQAICLTNDFRANDTYAEQNNDPESHLKSAAYIDPAPNLVHANEPFRLTGRVISGWSGLERVEYWLRPVAADVAPLSAEDPLYQAAPWLPCELESPPADWTGVLPADVSPRELLGFDPATGRPLTWPLRYTMVSWSTVLRDLKTGHYEFRARAVDLNGFAQPEPRPLAKSGKNAVEVHAFRVE